MNTIKKTKMMPRLTKLMATLALSLLLVYLLVWLLTGRIALYYLEDYLSSQSMSISDNARIEYNPFLSEVIVNDLEFRLEDGTPFRVDLIKIELTLTDLFEKTVTINEISVQGLDISLATDSDGFNVAGIDIPSSPDEPEPEPKEEENPAPFDWTIELQQLNIINTDISLSQDKIRQDTLQVDSLVIEETHFNSDQLKATLMAALAINNAPVRIDLNATVVQPMSSEDRELTGSGHLSIEGVDFKTYSSYLPQEVEKLAGIASTDSQFKLIYNGRHANLDVASIKLQLNDSDTQTSQLKAKIAKAELALKDLSISATKLDSQQPDLLVKLTPRLTLTGIDAVHPQEPNNQTFSTVGLTLDLGETFLTHSSSTEGTPEPRTQLSIDWGSIELEGINLHAQPILMTSGKQRLNFEALSLSLSGEALNFSIRPAIETTNTQIYLERDDNFLAGWETLKIPQGQISLTPDPTVAFPNITFEDLKLSNPTREAPSRHLAIAKSLNIHATELKDDHIGINRIALDSLDTELILDASRAIYNLIALSKEDKQNDVPAVAETSAPTDSATPNDGQAMTFSLGELDISANSKFKLVDRVNTPWFEYLLEIDKYRVGPIDTRNPELDTHIEFSAHAGEYAKFELNGKLKPLMPKVNLELTGSIKELPLAPKSFYIKDGLGYEIESGELDTDLSVSVKDNKIKGKTHLVMRSLDLIPAESVKVNEVHGGAISLNMAISMLKDGNGTVDVTVPLSGDIDDPKFGVSGFISIILKQAMMEAAKTYLVNTMVPYANIVSVAMIAGNHAFKLRFEPLPFEAKSTELTATQTDYLNQLKQVLEKNPEQIVKLCAVSIPGDIGLEVGDSFKPDEAQQQQLQEIGLVRERIVKKYMVYQGIGSARLLECKPKIENKKDAKARINLET